MGDGLLAEFVSVADAASSAPSISSAEWPGETPASPRISAST